MERASADLAQLRIELGEQAYLLQYAPLNKVKTEPLNDPEAVPFAIRFGYIRESDKAVRHTVWIYLYPATHMGGQPQVQFHSHDMDKNGDRYDAEGIAKIVSGYDAAFQHPGRWSKTKLIALAKYYFLEKLAEMGCNEEIMRFGVQLSKTFIDDLRAVCRQFEEEVKRLEASRPIPPQPAGVTHAADGDNGHDSQDSALSSPPLDLGIDDDQTLVEQPRGQEGQSMEEARVAEGLHADDGPEKTHDKIVDTLLELNKQEEAIKAEVTTINAQIAALEAKRTEKEAQEKQVDSDKERLFEGMTAAEAFKLGRDVEREQAEKHRKLS